VGKPNSVDAEALLRIAKAAESHESFSVVKKGRGFRIGAGARMLESGRFVFFIEAIVNLTPPSPAVDLQTLESRLRILERLTTMGYTLTYQDGLSILCEGEFRAENIGSECESLKAVLAEID